MSSKLTIGIPDPDGELYTELRALKKRTGKTIGWIAYEAIAEYLNNNLDVVSIPEPQEIHLNEREQATVVLLNGFKDALQGLGSHIEHIEKDYIEKIEKMGK